MAAKDDETEEPQDLPVPAPEAPQPKGRRRSFGKVRRELTEDELNSSGVQKMLLDEVERMDGSEAELKVMSEKYYEANTQLAVAREKLKTHNAFDVIATGTIAFGTLIVGIAFNIEGNESIKGTFYWFGGGLIVLGIIAKVMRA